VDLLGQQEREVMRRHADMLDGIEKEQVNTSYKLVTLQALWSWFGTNAGQPGTVQYVELVPDKPHWQMRPASPAATRDESANRQK
jgi:hypothetical protein